MKLINFYTLITTPELSNRPLMTTSILSDNDKRLSLETTRNMLAAIHGARAMNVPVSKVRLGIAVLDFVALEDGCRIFGMQKGQDTQQILDVGALVFGGFKACGMLAEFAKRVGKEESAITVDDINIDEVIAMLTDAFTIEAQMISGSEEGNRLKKHPKLVAMQVEIAKPMGKKEMEMEGKEPEMEMEPGEGMKHEMDEGPEMEGIEDVLEALPEELKSKLVKYLSK